MKLKVVVYNKLKVFCTWWHNNISVKKPYKLQIFFGLPGSGKSTKAASIVAHNELIGRKTFSNVPITGAFEYSPHDDLGKFFIHDCDLIIDEAGLEYNNRNFKSFTQDETYFFKYHRHYKVNIYVFSQSYDDMDKKIRALATELFVVKKSLLPKFIVCRRIKKKIGINEQTKDIVDEYYFNNFILSLLFDNRFFAPLYYKRFNTYSHKHLPEKEFILY